MNQPINATERIGEMMGRIAAQVAAPRPSFDQLGKLLLLQAEAGVLSTVPALATEAEELIAALETRLEKRGSPQ